MIETNIYLSGKRLEITRLHCILIPK